ncbi:hypothetical protein AGOR_G00076240 [Albula goreensis]|uniref:Uncharacterized protein n=1 Tax=Albula goreensis TaxID=1534307 RepID=A0A8T3DWZ7_9TELE|nr:hypothetical protein AGOR_G00076240 [Albula goreensis]
MDLEFIGLIVGMILSYVMPMVFGAYGVMHLEDCTQQPYIPIYMGVVGLLVLAAQLPYLSCCERRTEGRPMLQSLLRAAKVVLFIILICWFIAGSVWIYSIYPPNYDSSGKEAYCAKTLYLFAFWFHNVCYICIGLGLIAGLYFYLKGDCDVNICSCFKPRSYTPLE